MKFALPVLTALTVIGCSNGSAPTGPNPALAAASPLPSPPAPPSAATAWLQGFVVEPGGRCVEGAVVQVVSGQAQGQQVMQETPCDAWAYSGGFSFKGLTPGVEMTLRASAPAWTTEEKTIVPHSGAQMAVLIELKTL
jgi:hypothetical protein